MSNDQFLNVRFGKNFWSAAHGEPAQPIFVGLHFLLGKYECRIPFLYVSKEGLTADILLMLNSDEIRTFCKKYADVDKDGLSPVEDHLIHAEHPVPEVDFRLMMCNGKPLSPAEQSSFVHIPFLPQRAGSAALAQVRSAYAPYCSSDECWQCVRTHSAWASPKPERVQSISVEAMVHPRPHAVNLPFTLTEDTAQDVSVSFRHPVTGHEHTVYINEFDFLHRGPTPTLPQLPEGWIPAIAYEIVPPLPAGERAEILEAGLPVMECDRPELCGIVGFADNSLPGAHGEKLYAANGWMRPERGGTVRMVLAGITQVHCRSTRYTFDF